MITLFRTNRAYAASHEYFVCYPDGYQCNIWSPVWNEFESFEEEEADAYKIVSMLWDKKMHIDSIKTTIDELES